MINVLQVLSPYDVAIFNCPQSGLANQTTILHHICYADQKQITLRLLHIIILKACQLDSLNNLHPSMSQNSYIILFFIIILIPPNSLSIPLSLFSLLVQDIFYEWLIMSQNYCISNNGFIKYIVQSLKAK